jgi:hypothetical protein
MLRTVSEPGKSLERASVIDVHRDDAENADWADVADWVRHRSLVVAGLVMIAAQLVWKWAFLSHYFFSQDDYHYLDFARNSRFSWAFLTQVQAGHLIPGPLAIDWVLSRVALYDWSAASAVTLVLIAAASLVGLRLLRTLFGDRPAVLVLLGIYLLTPLMFPDISWWAVAIETVPLQLATFGALDAHVRYLRSGRFRHAVASAGWIVFGLIFFEKSMVLPLLLLAVTAAFFAEGSWLRAIGSCLARHWKAWLLYLAVVAAYLPVFVIALRTSTTLPGSPGQGGLEFMTDLLKNTFVPGALGGPWQWFALGGTAYPATSAGLVWLAWIVAAAIVGMSIFNRRHAWRAWIILLGWLVIADMIPILLGRTRFLGALLSLETRYVADAVPVLVICLGLAFLRITGRPDDRRQLVIVPGGSRIGTAAVAGVLGAFAVGSILSVLGFQDATNGSAARSYLANVSAALQAAPAGTVIVNFPVPPTLMEVALFGRYGLTAVVDGELARGNGNVRWVQQPSGIIDKLRAFNSEGTLQQVIIYGSTTPPGPHGCWPFVNGQATIPLTSSAIARTLRIDYLAGTNETVIVEFGSQSQEIILKAGLHSAYLPVDGRASDIVVYGPAKGLCLGASSAGVLFPAS